MVFAIVVPISNVIIVLVVTVAMVSPLLVLMLLWLLLPLLLVLLILLLLLVLQCCCCRLFSWDWNSLLIRYSYLTIFNYSIDSHETSLAICRRYY